MLRYNKTERKNTLLKLGAFRLSVVKPKPKLLQRPIRRLKYLSEPIRLKVKTSKLPKARDNACDEVVIGLVLHGCD